MATLAEAFVLVRPNLTQLGPETQAGTAAAMGKAGDEGGKRFSSGVLAHVKTMAASMVGLLAVGGVVDIFKDSLSEARESIKVSRDTEAVLKSTGGAAGLTAKQVGDLANSISRKVGIDDEAIQSGENILLTFTKVRNEAGKGNDIFNQGTKIAVDLSKRMGGDLNGAMVQVGKALNDPIRGMTTLRRVGVSFTDQQTEQVKAMVASGNTMGAQKIILAELQKEFGGSAEAMASPAEKAQVAWKNFEEQLGLQMLPVIDLVLRGLTGMLPVIGIVASAIKSGLGVAIAAIAGWIKDNLVPAWNLLTAGFRGASDELGGGGFGSRLVQIGGILRTIWNIIVADIVPVLRQFGSVLLQIGTWIFTSLVPALVSVGGWLLGTSKAASLVRDVIYALLAVFVLWKAAMLGAQAVILAYRIYVLASAAAQAIWTGAVALFNAVLSANPLVLIGIAIVALIVLVIWAWQNFAGFRDVVISVWNGIQAAALWAWNNVLQPIFTLIWWYISNVIIPIFLLYWNIVQLVWEGIKAAFNIAWIVVSAVFGAIVWTIVNVIVPWFQFMWTIIKFAWDVIIQMFNIAWVVVSAVFNAIVWAIANIIVPWFQFMWTIIKFAWDVIIQMFNIAWAVIATIFNFIQAIINGVIIPVFNFLWAVVIGVWNGIVAAFNFAWGVVSGIFNLIVWIINTLVLPWFRFMFAVIQQMWLQIIGVFQFAWGIISGIFNAVVDAVQNKVPAAFNAAVGFIKAAWNGIIDAAKAPVKFVIDEVINRVLIVDGFNKIAGALHIPGLPEIHSGFAHGGPTEPDGMYYGLGSETSDSNLIRISNREYIVNARAAAEYRPLLDAINYGALPQFSAGGIFQLAQKSGIPGLSMSSGYRPGDPGYHGQNKAADIIAPSQGGMDQLASWFMSNYASGMLELIHSPSWYVKNGHQVSAGFYGPAIVAQHYNHVHAAIDDGPLAQMLGGGGKGGFLSAIGGFFGSVFNFLGKFSSPVDWLLDKVKGPLNDILGKFPGNKMAEAGKGMAQKTVDSVIDKVKSLVSNMFGGGGGGAAGFGGVPKSALQQYAMGLLASFGWGTDQFGPLQKLWDGESGWNPNAVNPSSGAYGIPQALGHGHPYNLGDGQAQIQWGLNYIKQRYGNPANAFSMWSARSPHWYSHGGPVLFDQGGQWPTDTLGVNASGKTEYVSSNDAMERVVDRLERLIDAVEAVAPGVGRELTGVGSSVRSAARRR